VALLSETHLKPHERLFIPNYHIYRTDRFPNSKGGTAVALRKPYKPTFFVSVETSGVCMPTGYCEVLHAAVYKSPDRAWSDTDIIELLSFRNKPLVASELNAKQARNYWIYLMLMSLKFQRHSIRLILLRGTVMCSMLWLIEFSDCQKSLSLTSWAQTYQSFSTY
jgi:hypothetical protein